MLITILKTKTDWCNRDGRIGFKAVEYTLPTMEVEDIKILDIQLKADKALFEEILYRDDLDEIEGWETYVRSMIGIRKRQLAAISIEFLRRKKLSKPLNQFAFSAVHDLLGPDVVKQVRERARELMDKDNEAIVAMPKKTQWIPSTFPSSESTMCGNKIRHRDSREANEHIESMKANGKNTRGIVAYGPCPFCGFYHVGHKPKGALWSRADLKITEEP